MNFKNEAERFLRLANGEKFEHAVWERQEGRVLRKVFSFIDEIFDDLDGFSVIEVDEESDDLAIAIVPWGDARRGFCLNARAKGTNIVIWASNLAASKIENLTNKHFSLTEADLSAEEFKKILAEIFSSINLEPN